MDTRKISYSKQLVDDAIYQDRLRGLGDGYLTRVMGLPNQIAEYLLPDSGYTPGELRSSPKDRFRGGLQAWEEHRAGQGADYQRGDMLSNAPAFMLDPFMDLPLGIAARAGQAYKAVRGLGQFGKAPVGGGIPDISPQDAARAYAQVKDAMRGVDPNSDRFMQLQIMGQQYADIMSGRAKASDFAAPLLDDGGAIYYHGSPADNAQRILEEGKIKSRKAGNLKQISGGMTTEDDLIWVSPEERIANFYAEGGEARMVREGIEPGAIFATEDITGLRMLDRNAPLTAEQAALINKYLPSYKPIGEGDSIGSAVDWRSNGRLSYGQALRELGYDALTLGPKQVGLVRDELPVKLHKGLGSFGKKK